MNKKYLFWLIPIALFIAQAVFTFNSFGQVRSEDIHTSIREVFWWQNRESFGFQNSNYGWYTNLNLLYSLFGFDINIPKFYRLALSFLSLFCLASVLKKYLGWKWAIVPLLTIGFSPELLFFNTLNLPYGIDLQYLPIVLYLILARPSFVRLAGWALAMVAWLSYPSFVFYLPSMFALALKQTARKNLAATFLFSFLSFILSLILVILWNSESLNMIYDPTVNRGIFMAGGGFMLNADNFIKTQAAIFENLFIRASSYYLELSVVEFSHILPFFSFIFVLWTSFLIFKKQKFVVGWAFLTAVFNIIVIGLTIDGGMPGGRRNTPVLAAFYILFSVVWYAVNTGRLKLAFKKELALGILYIILIHHIIAYPFNLAHLKDPSPFSESTWFGGDTKQNLAKMVDDLQKKDLYLNCQQFFEKGIMECSYSNIYAALKGACLWDKLSCHDIYGNFPNKGFQKLDIKLWDKEYAFEKD